MKHERDQPAGVRERRGQGQRKRRRGGKSEDSSPACSADGPCERSWNLASLVDEHGRSGAGRRPSSRRDEAPNASETGSTPSSAAGSAGGRRRDRGIDGDTEPCVLGLSERTGAATSRNLPASPSQRLTCLNRREEEERRRLAVSLGGWPGCVQYDYCSMGSAGRQACAQRVQRCRETVHQHSVSRASTRHA